MEVMIPKKMFRSYSELKKLKTFDERYEYLKLDGVVGESTFGFDRYLNQIFYRSKEWGRIRDIVITRDNGNDLGISGYEITKSIYVHHMNPIDKDDVLIRSSDILNPEYLICCSYNTHEAIHYGDESLLPKIFVERSPGDTLLW